MDRRILAAGTAAALFMILVPSLASGRGNRTIDSINTAKKILSRQIYSDHRTTFYCGATFDESGGITDYRGYEPRKDSARARRIEWEHVVPAESFGRSFPEWREGHPDCVDNRGSPFRGRNCAAKVNSEYRLMEADMHNLVPAIGEINALRSNYSFAVIPGEPRKFGGCDMEIEDRKAEPPAAVRGDIARTYFYMDWAYPGRSILGRRSARLFSAWDTEDPVDRWECTRAARIERLQGNGNPLVKSRCLEAELWQR